MVAFVGLLSDIKVSMRIKCNRENKFSHNWHFNNIKFTEFIASEFTRSHNWDFNIWKFVNPLHLDTKVFSCKHTPVNWSSLDAA